MALPMGSAKQVLALGKYLRNSCNLTIMTSVKCNPDNFLQDS